MKHLNTYITEYIVKKKLDKPINSEDHYKYFPKTKNNLIDNIIELLDNGETNFNCIDTSNITDMSKLFYHENFEEINFDVSNWNVSNVTNMNHMFIFCENFDCDLSKWDVSNVKDMGSTFDNCHNFKGKGLENWDVSNVANMRHMFYSCINFNYDLSNWNVSKVENMSNMFS